MALVDLWHESPDQLQDKKFQQLIGFAGDGRLGDGRLASTELRDFLRLVSSVMIKRYADECLSESFKDSGFALQDLVNEIGMRLGFKVRHGRYRGTAGSIGFDGLWSAPEGNQIVVEVKTTDAYRIDLNLVAGYRRELIKSHEIDEDDSSILIVVGRQDTGDLEAQTRGSKHAWDVRLISVDALLRLLSIREEVEDPRIEIRIRTILVPREYTRVDEIIEVLFSTAEDILQEEWAADQTGGDVSDEDQQKREKPVSFNEACAEQIGRILKINFLKRSRATFSTPDGSVALVCAVSKAYTDGRGEGFWFAFHPHQRQMLQAANKSYVGFGCGSSNQIILFKFSEFEKFLHSMNQTHRDDGTYYWHVQLRQESGNWRLQLRKGEDQPDITDHLLKVNQNSQ